MQVNETVYNYMKFSNTICQDLISTCKKTNRTSLADYAICSEATNVCRDTVGTYTISHRLGRVEPEKSQD